MDYAFLLGGTYRTMVQCIQSFVASNAPLSPYDVSECHGRSRQVQDDDFLMIASTRINKAREDERGSGYGYSMDGSRRGGINTESIAIEYCVYSILFYAEFGERFTGEFIPVARI